LVRSGFFIPFHDSRKSRTDNGIIVLSFDKADFQPGKEEKSPDELCLSGKTPLFPICRVF